jgi:hypothetical protein
VIRRFRAWLCRRWGHVPPLSGFVPTAGIWPGVEWRPRCRRCGAAVLIDFRDGRVVAAAPTEARPS